MSLASSTATRSSRLFAPPTPSTKSALGRNTRTPSSTRAFCSVSTRTRRLFAGRNYVSESNLPSVGYNILTILYSQAGAHQESWQAEKEGYCRRKGLPRYSLRSLNYLILPEDCVIMLPKMLSGMYIELCVTCMIWNLICVICHLTKYWSVVRKIQR